MVVLINHLQDRQPVHQGKYTVRTCTLCNMLIMEASTGSRIRTSSGNTDNSSVSLSVNCLHKLAVAPVKSHQEGPL